MKIGIGLPNTTPGVAGETLLAWARRAEERGFSGLATIDRIAYPNYDSLIALAAAAGATSRIELTTNILLAPLYPTAVLAKGAASLDQLSGGRFTLGVAPGGRPDDYAAVGADFHRRGRVLDRQLEELHRIWAGGAVAESSKPASPDPSNGASVPILVGGASDRAVQRACRWGAGWTMGGGTPEMAAPIIDQLHRGWADAGREGAPRVAALAYFALGPDADEGSRRYLHHYYAFLGEYAEMIAAGALRSEDAVREAVRTFAAIGVTELYLDPTIAEIDQVDRLADVVL